MKYPFTRTTLTLSVALLLTACDRQESGTVPLEPIVPAQVTDAGSPAEPAGTPAAAATEQSVTEIEWDALIPADWRIDAMLEEYSADDLADDDPRAKELLEKMKQFWKEAPVVEELDGRTVKLPGFIVPLEMNATEIREFLLVPYYGACIHTPPPPANQTVHVVTDEKRAYQGDLFDIVWVTGTMKVERVSSELGDAGYRIAATLVEPYE